MCLGEANIISECHDQTCPGTKWLVYDHKNKLRYIKSNTACIPIFLCTFILMLEEDYVELDDIVEDLNDLDEKSEDEQKPNKPETGK